MSDNILGTFITPTETASYFNLLIVGGIVGLGVLALSELIKNKSTVPTSQIYLWSGVFGLAAAASVYDIYKSSV